MAEISVIIPVYNSTKYIVRCIDSLKAQTFGDWEAICVDDGSTDGSAEILDKLSAADHRIRVVHKANEGVSVARNMGVSLADGQYIGFIDSDDFIHPQTFEICKRFFTSTQADLVAFTYSRKYRLNTILRHALHIPEKKRIKFSHFNTEEIDSLCVEDIFEYATELSHPKVPKEKRRWMVKHCQPWRCLYRREVVESLKFTPGIIYEDLPWWGEVLLKTKKAVILNLPLYYYYPNRRSYIFSSDQTFKIKSLITAISKSESFYKKHATPRQHALWTQNFITPFKAKLANKQKSC